MIEMLNSEADSVLPRNCNEDQDYLTPSFHVGRSGKIGEFVFYSPGSDPEIPVNSLDGIDLDWAEKLQ